MGHFLYNSLSKSLKYDLWQLWAISNTIPYQNHWPWHDKFDVNFVVLGSPRPWHDKFDVNFVVLGSPWPWHDNCYVKFVVLGPKNMHVFWNICVICHIFTWDVHVRQVSCNIFTWIYGCIMLYIHPKIYMKLYMYYVIYIHEDIHVLCNIFTWRDTCMMN